MLASSGILSISGHLRVTPGSQQLEPLLCLQTVNWTAQKAGIQRFSGRPEENMCLLSKHLGLSCAQFQALSTQPATLGLLQCLLLKAPGGILNSPLLFTHFLPVFIFELYPVFKGILPSLGAREKHVLTVQGQPLHSSLGLFCEKGRTEQVTPFPLSFHPDFGAWQKLK